MSLTTDMNSSNIGAFKKRATVSSLLSSHIILETSSDYSSFFGRDKDLNIRYSAVFNLSSSFLSGIRIEVLSCEHLLIERVRFHDGVFGVPIVPILVLQVLLQ